MDQNYTESYPNHYRRNRFVIDFETDGIKDYYVESASFCGDHLLVKFRNSDVFFAPEYFSNNKRFETVRIFLLNHAGEKKAMITFYNAGVEGFQTDMLDYKDGEMLFTNIILKFKKVVYSNNVNEIEKDPQ